MTTTIDTSVHDHHFTTIDLDVDDNDKDAMDQDWQEFNNFQFDVVLKYWNSLERKALDQGLPSLFPPARRRKDFISCMDKDKGRLLPTIEEGQEEPVVSPSSEKQIASTITPKMSTIPIAKTKKGKSYDVSIPSLVEQPVIQTMVREDREKEFYPLNYSNPTIVVGVCGGEPPSPLQGNQHLQMSKQEEEDTTEKLKDIRGQSFQLADSNPFISSDGCTLKESRDDDEESDLQSKVECNTVVTIENVNDRDEEFDLLPTEEVTKGLLINTETVEEPIIFSGDGKEDTSYSEVSEAIENENNRDKEDNENKANPDSVATENRDEGRCTTLQRATSDSVLLSSKPDEPKVFEKDDSRGTVSSLSSDCNLVKQTKVRGKRDKDPRLLQRAMSDHIIASTTSRDKHSSMAVMRTVSIQDRNSFLAKLVALLKMRLSLWTKWKGSAAGGHGKADAGKQLRRKSTPQQQI